MMKYFILLLSFNAFASGPIIYGEDNRLDTFETKSALYKELALSTAAMVDKNKIKIHGNVAELIGPSLGEAFKLCEKERFHHQSFIATCSGFLVAPDIIITAGHCYETRPDCTQFDWVFNYKVDNAKQKKVSVDVNDIYKCKEVIAQKFTSTLDFAVVKLDRPVININPVKITNGPIEIGTPVVMIGHPSGLPQKVTDNAVVTNVSATEFKATLDSFQINSGSAVFNAENGELLGILVRGLIDYRMNEQYQCVEVNTTPDDTRGGEDISTYTQFTPYL